MAGVRVAAVAVLTVALCLATRATAEIVDTCPSGCDVLCDTNFDTGANEAVATVLQASSLEECHKLCSEVEGAVFYSWALVKPEKPFCACNKVCKEATKKLGFPTQSGLVSSHCPLASQTTCPSMLHPRVLPTLEEAKQDAARHHAAAAAGGEEDEEDEPEAE